MKINKIAGGTQPLGIYIHIPFCLQKCHYCDFYSEARSTSALRAKYTDVLCSEIEHYGVLLGSGAAGNSEGSNRTPGGEACDLTAGDRLVDTIFIGGGTPSILQADQTVRILSTIFDNFRVADGAEISMECNPATLTAEKLAAYKEAGINRLSMGVQSMDPGILQIMGRAHGPEDVISNFRLAREAGFDNINLDIMFGVPGQDMDIWRNTVQTVLDLKPEHLSFYSLELAEETEFYRRLASGQLKETPPEEDRKMYHWLLERLKEYGYGHYEISNAALPGRECRHNLKYWNMDDYLGMGAAAHSFVDGMRFSNVPDVSKYIKAWQRDRDAVIKKNDSNHGTGLVNGGSNILAASVDWQYVNSWEDSVSDCTFTALRRAEGIKKKDFAEKFGREFWEVFADRKEEFQDFVRTGDAEDTGDAVRITEKGMDIANQIITLFV